MHFITNHLKMDLCLGPGTPVCTVGLPVWTRLLLCIICRVGSWAFVSGWQKLVSGCAVSDHVSDVKQSVPCTPKLFLRRPELQNDVGWAWMWADTLLHDSHDPSMEMCKNCRLTVLSRWGVPELLHHHEREKGKMILCSNLGVKTNRETENSLAWSGERRALLCTGFSASLSTSEVWLHAPRAEPRHSTWRSHLSVLLPWVLPGAGLKKTDNPSSSACLSSSADCSEMLLFCQGSPSVPCTGRSHDPWGCRHRWERIAALPSSSPHRGAPCAPQRVRCPFLFFNKHHNWELCCADVVIPYDPCI